MRIAIAEDSAILRDGLGELLTARGFDICVSVGDAGALLEAIDAGAAPDLAIIDVRMPPTHTDEGIRAAIELRERRPDIAVLIFSQYVETNHARRLLAGNASGVGYLLKDRVANVSDFVAAVERIQRGETVLDPEVVANLLAAASERSVLDTLTGREREVLTLMAEGHSNAGIAAQASLSTGGVEKNIASIFTKLGLEQSSETHRRVLAVLRYLED